MGKKHKVGEILINGGIKHEDDLPLPYVKYPSNHYHFLIQFGLSEDGEFFTCSCFEKSINNFWTHKKSEHNSIREKSWEECYLDGELGEFYQKFYDKNHKFKENICHECNELTPSVEYCHPMYGGKFKRQYGWYIKKRYFEMVVCPDDQRDDEITEMLNHIEYLKKHHKNIIERNKIDDLFNIKKSKRKGFFKKESDWEKKVRLEKDISKLKREIDNIPENETRKIFGYKPIGQQWVNETFIYKICKELFPQYNIVHHFRPKILEGLELDIFIEELNTGIEYQGKQHYEPIDFFGGEESFQKVKIRDKKKKLLCEKNNINLIYFRYDEVVSKKNLKNKLNKLELDLSF